MNFRSVWNRFLRLLSIRQPRSKREASASLNLEKLEDRVNPSGLFLTQSEVQELADAAVDQWVEAGISQEQLEVLQNLNYQIADLGEHHLGQYRPGRITVDDNAAGRLWFGDATPDLNEEFVGEGNSFVAIEDTLAYRKIDLLTVLIHEQGHALGLTGQIGSVDDVMNETLQDGIRRLPILDQAEDAIPGSITTLQ